MRKWQYGTEAVAAKEFVRAGVRYEKGARFPYKDLGVIEFDMRGLYAADLVDFTGKPYGSAVAPKEPDDAELERLTAPTPLPPQKPQAKQQASSARR